MDASSEMGREPEYLEKWLTPGIHPPEYKEAVIDYLLEWGKQSPAYYFKNWTIIRYYE